jgi:hypothetical protein
MKSISERRALTATLKFLVNMRDLGWPSLPGLLGSMLVVDGRALDPILEEDWKEAVESSVEEENVDDGGPLPISTAYQIAFSFLDKQFKRGYESIDDVITGFGPNRTPERASQMDEDWALALKRATASQD